MHPSGGGNVLKDSARALVEKVRKVALRGLERETDYLRLIVKEAHALEMRLLSNPRSQQLKSIMVPGERERSQEIHPFYSLTTTLPSIYMLS